MPHISTADIPFYLSAPRPPLTLYGKLIKHLKAITTFAALQFNDANVDVDVCHCMSAPLGMQFHGKGTPIETETETALGEYQMQTTRGKLLSPFPALPCPALASLPARQAAVALSAAAITEMRRK